MLVIKAYLVMNSKSKLICFHKQIVCILKHNYLPYVFFSLCNYHATYDEIMPRNYVCNYHATYDETNFKFVSDVACTICIDECDRLQ